MPLPEDSQGQAYLAAFQQGLQQLGWSVGRNLQIELRWGGNDAERWRSQVREVLALAPDVVVTGRRGCVRTATGQP